MTAQMGIVCREIVIDSTNNQIVFTENGGGNLTATIATGTYFLDESSDGLLPAIETALNAASSVYTFTGGFVQMAASLGLSSPVDDLWCAVWLFATPDPTLANNVVFKWTHASTTFDPALIGMALDGADLTWYDEGSYTRAYSTHAPTPVFAPNAPLAMDDAPKDHADIITHVSPNNARSHYEMQDREKRRTWAWETLSYERVHYKKSGLAFTGEQWGCLESVWEQRTYLGGRMRLYRHDLNSSISSPATTSSEYVGDYVFSDGPPRRIPTVRTDVSQELYSVGPMVLSPYVTP